MHSIVCDMPIARVLHGTCKCMLYIYLHFKSCEIEVKEHYATGSYKEHNVMQDIK